MRVTVHEHETPLEANSKERVLELLSLASDEAKQKNKQNIVFLGAENGNEMSVVVGGKESVLCFSYAGNNPPYLASRGETAGEQPVLTAFVCLEHHTEYPRQWVISMDAAIGAVSEFRASQDLPNSVAWAEV